MDGWMGHFRANIQRSMPWMDDAHPFRIMSIGHYSDAIMGTIASQITSLTIVYSTVYSGTDQRKHQNSASLAFVRVIHRSPVNYPHKGPVTRKMFPFDDVIMSSHSWDHAISNFDFETSMCGQSARSCSQPNIYQLFCIFQRAICLF